MHSIAVGCIHWLAEPLNLDSETDECAASPRDREGAAAAWDLLARLATWSHRFLMRERMGVAVKIPKTENAPRLKGQTLRLSPEAWLNLKVLAAILDGERGSRVTQHDVLLEAVEDLFVKYRNHLPALGN
jgi:hypothetical protein